MTAAPYTPDVAAIAADLGDDHLFIESSVADQITPAQLAAIKASVDSSSVPMYVLALPYTDDESLSPVQLVSLVHRELPQDGIWFVARQKYDESWSTDSTTYGVTVHNTDFLARVVAEELYPTDLGQLLQKTTELIQTGTAEEAYAKTFPERAERTGRPSTQQDDGSQLFGVDLPVALTGIGVIAVVVAVIGMRRRPSRRDGIAVKERALRRISTAQTTSWRHRAEAETARLGERVTALEIGDGSDRAAWTAALDHYEAANRVLDRTTSAAHSIGALVLARRGDDALDHAIAGKPWQPTAVCFFNPLHGAGTTTVRWETSAGARDVPACVECRRIVRKKKEPDFLDLPVGDTVVHYVDADAEPWTSTGYGSLDPDLLAHVKDI